MPDVVNSTESPGGEINVPPVTGTCPRSRKNSTKVVTVVSEVCMARSNRGRGDRGIARIQQETRRSIGRRVTSFADGFQAAAADELAARAASARLFDMS